MKNQGASVVITHHSFSSAFAALFLRFFQQTLLWRSLCYCYPFIYQPQHIEFNHKNQISCYKKMMLLPILLYLRRLTKKSLYQNSEDRM
jgi:hypothetical protein